ncbi:MAG: class II fructose-bisphosphate aldolase [Nitrospinota bacterium]
MWVDRGECNAALEGVIEVKEDGSVQVKDQGRLRGDIIDDLAYQGVHHASAEMRDYCRWLIRRVGEAQGIHPASIHDLYMAMGRGEAGGFTVPAINIRGLTFDVARAVVRAALARGVGALIFEIARSEIGYTEQRPGEYGSSVLAAAVKEGFRGPIFLQGDHFQVNAKKFAEDPDKELDALRDLIREALDAGFYNVDIDSSTLADLSKPDVKEQQRLNFEKAAELTRFIREIEPEGVTVSVGGEVGEVGGKNTTVEEAGVFIENFRQTLASDGSDLVGISKLSIQTGTRHGGVVLPDGSIAQVSIDFDALGDISKLCRERYGLSGAVQHGASTLPEEFFDRFVKSGASEVHLATAFQNILYERIPQELRHEVHAWVLKTFESSRKKGDTDEQLIYKERKRAFGPFKKSFSDLPEDARSRVRTSLEERFGFLFEKLNVVNTREAVDRFVKPVKVSIPVPAAL